MFYFTFTYNPCDLSKVENVDTLDGCHERMEADNYLDKHLTFVWQLYAVPKVFGVEIIPGMSNPSLMT